MNIRKIGVVLLALLLAGMAIVPMVSAAEDLTADKMMADPYYSAAVKVISQEKAIPGDQFSPLNIGIASYPLTNKKLHAIKLLDQKNGNTYSVYLDDNYKVADPKLYSENENSEFTKSYGKFEPELSDRLKNAKSDEVIPVWIWLQNPPEATPVPEGIISPDELKNNLENQRKIYSSNSKNIVDLLSGKGIKITYVSQYSPSLFAEVPVSTLRELEKNSDVTGIYLQRAYQPQLYSASRAIKADSVWSQGITGSGVKVAVMENGRIAYANPYLMDGTTYNPSGPITDHATAVAGMIASTDTVNRGPGYGVTLMSANANSVYDSDQIAACEWAITNNADIISISMGAETNLYLNPMDRYLDHIVQNHHKTVTVAAGNSASGGTGQVMSPGLGYNMITVGALDDKDTLSLTDDVMATYSSYKNPHSDHEDRQKPEVVAPGGQYGSSTMMGTATASPWISDRGAGTSYAAPIAAGEAALLMQQQSALKSWPETVKAIIMASAVHNIEGSSRLSDKDGAGGLDASQGIATITNNRYQSNTLYSTSFPQSHTVYLQAGQKVRAVASWDSQPPVAHPPTTDPLMADLDLVVFNPSGGFVTNSNSWDNNYEIVEFTASTTGNYNIRLDKSRFDGSSERVGFAYTIF